MFVGEVVVAARILVGTRLIREPAREGRVPRLDWVGSVLTASGLALIVIGVLQASNWGWLKPLDSPVEPLGFSLTPFVIAAGGLVLAASAPGNAAARSRDATRWSTSACSRSRGCAPASRCCWSRT